METCNFIWGLALLLWGWICKWATNELKVFSLWELINQGAPPLHIYIFLKSSRGVSSHKLQRFSRPITLNITLKCTIIQLWASHMYVCPLHFLKSACSRGLLQWEAGEGGDERKRGKSERGGRNRDRRQKKWVINKVPEWGRCSEGLSWSGSLVQ